MEEDSNLTEKLVQSPLLDSRDEEGPTETVRPVPPPVGDTALGGDSDGIPAPDQDWTKGEKQPVQFRDVPFAVLFFAAQCAVAVVAFLYGVPAMRNTEQGEEEQGSEYIGWVYLALIAGGSAFLLSAVSLAAMARFAESLVKVSLLFSVMMSILIVVIALLENNIVLAVFGLISSLIGLCYAWAVWDRIPFAAANLKTALSAIKANYGITFVAYFLVVVSFAWSILWLVAVVGVRVLTADCKDGTCQENDIGVGIIFLLFLALFWMEEVIKNTIHVTVAGTVGEWWFDPANASSCCSEAIRGSLVRATTYSFGSICLGSLLVALIQATRQIIQNVRNNGDSDNILLCVAQCILACLESLLEYFNKWAYVYVGLYGYGYMEAGKNVMALFQQRGWTTVITDNLVSNTLSLVCLVIAGMSGCVGLVLDAVQSTWFESFGEISPYAAFFIAFAIGLVIASILMSVIDSAVNTVIVCFAEAPAEFQANHPELSEQMRSAWGDVYPESMLTSEDV